MKKGKSERLLGYVEAIETLEARKREIAQDIAAKVKAARGDGFDPVIIRAMIRERRMTAIEREEHRALLDIYRAALGMLADTPLGEAARRRLAGDPPKTTPGDDAPDAPLSPSPPTPEDVMKARAEGAGAAKAGRAVTTNPHPAGDPRRAAWDEGWCAAAGSDGMEIPPAWRRSRPAKGDGKGDPK